MRFNYSKLLSVVFQHSFYADNRLNNLQAFVTKDTQQLMDNYGLVWKQAGNQLQVYYDAVDDSIGEKLAELKYNRAKLQFYFTIDDGYFLNYTDLPFDQMESIIYLSNVVDTGGKGQENIFLSQKSNIGVSDLVNLVGNIVKIGKKSNDSNAILKIYNTFKEDLTAQAGITINVDKSISIDFSSLGSGRYDIVIGKNEPIKILVNDFTDKSNVVAVSELYLGGTEKGKELINDKGEATPQKFVAQFNCRSVYWKYLVMSKHLQELEGLSIANGKSGIVFLGPDIEEVVEGTSAKSFISKEPLPLRAFKEYKLQLLKATGKGAAKVVMSSLPVPEPKSVKAGRDRSGRLISEIFIY